jgi:hypothetical protein
MKLKVCDKDIFDQWYAQLIKKLALRTSLDIDEEAIKLLNIAGIDSQLSLREIEVIDDISVEGLIKLLTGKGSHTCEYLDQYRTKDTYYRLYCLSISNKVLDPSEKLSNYDIHENDTFLIEKTVDLNDTSIMHFVHIVNVKNAMDYYDFVRTSEYIKNLQSPSTYKASFASTASLLLYTDEDTDLAQYIRYNFLALNEMTGRNLNIYTIEQPNKVKGISTHEYWKATLNQTTYSLLHLIGLTKYKPYDKTEAYKIASSLGIYPDALPCVVLLGGNANDEKIVVSISEDPKTFFRGLSSIMLRIKQKPLLLKVKSDENFEEFKKSFLENWQMWQEELANKDHKITNNVFNDKTIFINKPIGEVKIENSQND